jgi:TIR domain
VAKVFVSHRGVDAAAAEQLAVELRLAGHDVWFDEWEIAPGDSIVGRINDGVDAAAYLILCCSSSGVTAPWIGREWMSALARQLDGQGVKVLPALLPGGTPPSILADLKYADLSTDWSSGVRDLLRVIW